MDIASTYTLVSTGGTAVFNGGDVGDGTDIYYLTNIVGLDVADIRAPQFLTPLAHGGYKPVKWLEHPLHPRFEGVLLVQSVASGNGCRQRRNEMWHHLKNVLRAMYDSPGTLTWNEPGVGSFSLSVFYEQPLAQFYSPGYTVMGFSFGLYSESSQPVVA